MKVYNICNKITNKMNNEFKKMQKLAGLIKENQTNEVSTTPSKKTWDCG